MKMKYELLKKYFGYETFRVGQEEVVDHIMLDKDVLGIMPTGGGKSLCYQLPALMKEGVTIVVSPLIALMKDQVDSLIENGISATFINSTLSAGETRARIDGIKQGDYKLVYVAPERLMTDSFYYLSQKIDIAFIAIDEAHCISQWGHDFRPSYKNIPIFINGIEKRPIVAAFTATATKHVIKEIITLLELREPFELLTGFDRPNLVYSVIKPIDKLKYVKNYIKDQFENGSGIIYCSTRKTVESLAKKLDSAKVPVEAYHGGMENDRRTKVQENFMFDKTKIIVATNAFGMGIDKPDVRFVIHYNMPKNMESYYQEAGRAGRDGEKSDCILIYSPSDIVKQKLIMAQNELSPERIKIQTENLQYLVNYCHSDACLRGKIIEYFGEKPEEDNCGNCGNCLEEIDYVDMTVEAQKILSCIYRTNQRFGVNVTIQTLRGSRNKKILDFRLDKISTYGILKEYSEGALREIIMNLIARGYILMTTDQFPVLKLTQKSSPVLKGLEKILVKRARMQVKDKKKGKARSKSTELNYDQELFNQLADVRRRIATDKKVPLYIIFSNATIEELAYYLPTKREEFLSIKGIGEKKFDTYGVEFIGVIDRYIKEHSIKTSLIEARWKEMTDEETTETNDNISLASQYSDRYEETYHHYKKGYSISELAKIRGFGENTIVKHLERLEAQGHTIEWNRFMGEEEEEEVMKAIREVGVSSLRTIKEEVGSAITYTHIHITIAKNSL